MARSPFTFATLAAATFAGACGAHTNTPVEPAAPEPAVEVSAPAEASEPASAGSASAEQTAEQTAKLAPVWQVFRVDDELRVELAVENLDQEPISVVSAYGAGPGVKLRIWLVRGEERALLQQVHSPAALQSMRSRVAARPVWTPVAANEISRASRFRFQLPADESLDGAQLELIASVRTSTSEMVELRSELVPLPDQYEG